MPVIPTIPMTQAPEPTETAPCPYPWRFRIGELVHVLGRALQDTYTVVGGELWMGFPHYKLYDHRTGTTWRVPQIHCSTKPLTYKKG